MSDSRILKELGALRRIRQLAIVDFSEVTPQKIADVTEDAKDIAKLLGLTYTKASISKDPDNGFIRLLASRRFSTPDELENGLGQMKQILVSKGFALVPTGIGAPRYQFRNTAKVQFAVSRTGNIVKARISCKLYFIGDIRF